MSDPRQEERLRSAPRNWMPTQVMDRISQRLSPVDDDLPFAQAKRAKEDMDKAAASFSKRNFT